MRSVNKVILIGNVTRNPETRHTQGGQAVCTFGLATNREWVTADGQKKNSAEYHELVAWAQLADICQKYVSKGKLLYIEGYLKTRSWDTPEGIRKFKTEVVVKDMIMLEKRSDSSDEYVPTGEKFSSDNDYSMNDLGSIDEEISTDTDNANNEASEIKEASKEEANSELDPNLLDDDLGL